MIFLVEKKWSTQITGTTLFGNYTIYIYLGILKELGYADELFFAPNIEILWYSFFNKVEYYVHVY